MKSETASDGTNLACLSKKLYNISSLSGATIVPMTWSSCTTITTGLFPETTPKIKSRANVSILRTSGMFGNKDQCMVYQGARVPYILCPDCQNSYIKPHEQAHLLMTGSDKQNTTAIARFSSSRVTIDIKPTVSMKTRFSWSHLYGFVMLTT